MPVKEKEAAYFLYTNKLFQNVQTQYEFWQIQVVNLVTASLKLRLDERDYRWFMLHHRTYSWHHLHQYKQVIC